MKTYSGPFPWDFPPPPAPAPARSDLIVRAADALYRLDMAERRSLATAVLAEDKS
jgi:hypothetical protein